MARPDKAATVKELKQKFESSDAVLLTEYRGLTVAQMRDLRVSLGENVSYAVVKNTLTAIAAKEAGITDLEELLSGPTAIAFVNGEPPEAAKALRDFAKANSQLVLKGGHWDGVLLNAEDVNKLADLEPREVLLAKAAGAMKAGLHQAAYLFTAPMVKAVRTVDALREKQDSAPASDD